MVNITNYGAVGDGTFDNSTAFQNAIIAAKASKHRFTSQLGYMQ
jgi:polygalacturonase